MAEVLFLHPLRDAVDDKYVKVKPNSSAIKPVHIAEACFKTLEGAYWKSKKLRALALVCSQKGEVYDNTLESVYESLLIEDSIDTSVSKQHLQTLRYLMQKTVSADKAVYVSKDLPDSMISYTAGSKFFITNPKLFSEGGVLLGLLVKTYCPTLANHVKSILDAGNDPITKLFIPVLTDEDDYTSFEVPFSLEEIPAFSTNNDSLRAFVEGLKESGECLAQNLKRHANPLNQLRIFNLFVVYHLIRYLTSLAPFYCNEPLRPVLLDFSGKRPGESSVAQASEMSYTQMYRSINRFYAWAFAQELKERFGGSIDELMNSEPPQYDEKGSTKAKAGEIAAHWNLAKENARTKKTDEEKFLVFGETVYDLLALEATSHPVLYLKALGTSAGILYPPDARHPNKRFAVSQDVVEMILYSCIRPDEVITDDSLKNRMWERFGAVVGGRPQDLQNLRGGNTILMVGESALEENAKAFFNVLVSMDYAEQMADGIMRIRVGGTNDVK